MIWLCFYLALVVLLLYGWNRLLTLGDRRSPRQRQLDRQRDDRQEFEALKKWQRKNKK